MGDPTRPAADARAAGSDRRDSRRVPIRLLVRDLGTGGSFDEREGNLSIWGVYFASPHPPVGREVEVRFSVPEPASEVTVVGEVLSALPEASRFGVHVRFRDVPVATELAIARFLEREPG